jgi:hypothetical protein
MRRASFSKMLDCRHNCPHAMKRDERFERRKCVRQNLARDQRRQPNGLQTDAHLKRTHLKQLELPLSNTSTCPSYVSMRYDVVTHNDT